MLRIYNQTEEKDLDLDLKIIYRGRDLNNNNNIIFEDDIILLFS